MLTDFFDQKICFFEQTVRKFVSIIENRYKTNLNSMKNPSRAFILASIVQLLVMLIIWSPKTFAQVLPSGQTYQDAKFLCSITNQVSYNLNTDTSGQANHLAQLGPNYGCLGATPVRPMWFRFQAGNSASLRMIPQPTTNANLNFVMYGPFQNPNPSISDLNASNIIACTNSPSLVDTIVASVIQNRYYILLLSNQEGYKGTVFFRTTVGNTAILTSTIAPSITNPITVVQCSAPFVINTWPSSSDISNLTFSGPGVNPNTGSFDPNTAGVGNHVITISGNPYDCGSTTTTYSISVTNCPTVPAISAVDTLCWNSPIPPIALTQMNPALLPPGVTVLRYEWEYSTNQVLWVSAGIGLNPTPRNLFQGIHWFRVFGVRSDGQRVSSNQESIFVLNPPQQPFITAASGNGSTGNNSSLTLTVCQGAELQFSYTLANGGGSNTFRYQWQRRDVRGGGWNNFGPTEDIVYATGVRTRTFVGFTDNSYLYRIQATDISSFLCGSIFSDSILVLVAGSNINPGVASSIASQCLNNSTTITATPASGVILMPNNPFSIPNCGRYTYQWQESNDNVNWTNIPGATLGNYNAPGRLNVSTRWYRRNCFYVLDGSCQVGNGLNVTLTGTVCPVTPVSSNSVSVSWVDDLPFVSAKRTQTMTGQFAHPWSSVGGVVSAQSSSGFNISSAVGASSSAFYRLSQGIVPSNGIIRFNSTVEYSTNSGITWSTTPPSGSFTASFELPGSPGSFSIFNNGQFQARVFEGDAIGFNISYSGASVSTSMRLRITSFSFHPRGANNSDTLCAGVPYTTNGSAVALHPVASSVVWIHNGQGTLSPSNSAVTTYTPSFQDNGRTITMSLIATRNDGVCQGRKDTVIQTIVYRPLYVKASIISATRDTVCYFSNPGVLTATPASGGSGPYAYQWQSKQRGSSIWRNIVGASNLTYSTIGQEFLTDSCYRILTTDLGTPSCANADSSGEYCIYVLPAMQASRHIGNSISICTGESTILTPSNTTGGNNCFSYTWQTIVPTDPSVVANPLQPQIWNWSNLAGYVNMPTTTCTTRTFRFNGDALYYRIVATDCELRPSRPSCGSVWSLPFLVRAVDTVKPTVIARDLTLFANASCSALAPAATGANLDSINSFGGLSFDNCRGSLLNWSISPTVFSPAGRHKAVVSATDSSGNVGTDTIWVTVLDTIKPVTRVRNITVYLNSQGVAVITPADVNNGSSDNCTRADSLRFTISRSTFGCSDLQIYNPSAGSRVNVILTTIDSSGNSHSATAIVTVRDTIKPTINNLPSNVTLNGVGPQCSATYMWTPPTASDNCVLRSFTASLTPNPCYIFPQGVTTITYTAIDSSGNTRIASFTVTVVGCTGAKLRLATLNTNCVDSTMAVSVTLDDYVGALGALSLTINYPSNQLIFDTITDYYGISRQDVSSNASNGRFRFGWAGPDSVNICGNAILFNIRFRTLGNFGSVALSFDQSIPENNELANASGTVIPCSFTGRTTTLIPCVGIIGKVTYPKSPAVPLSNVDVIIKTVALPAVSYTGKTNSSGDYYISGKPLTSGSVYKVSMNIPISDNGYNATDANKISLHAAGSFPLAGCRLLAGDVNSNLSINSSDALSVRLRFAGLLDSFPRGPWVTCDTLLSYDAILKTQNLSAVVTGDVDLSKTVFTPVTPRYSSINLASYGVVSRDKNGFVTPVYLDQVVELGAASIVLTLPDGMLVHDVRFSSNSSESWTWNQIGNSLRLAWNSIHGLSSTPDVPLFNIHSSSLGHGEIALVAEETEFASPLSEVIGGLGIKVANRNSVNRSVSIYPNPSNGLFNLNGNMERYDVYDMSGRLVLSEISPSTSVALDMRNHSEGVYHVHVNTTEGIEVLRIVIRK